ncbi:DUF3857 domain-containing protein [Desertivirga xinjiangensis]|uniref:DUF3857 domain-containing protein n=1 Tax=Desertivirga xinjiangensis TaxID=539206 RepID=UPI00210892A5|nr:DUF3857 domain-containing protein [Pedobacter xinjiangensis]
MFVLDYQLKHLYDSEKFSEVEAELEKRIRLYGEDETTYGYKIGILNHEKKYEDLIKLSEKMYQLYPENTTVLNMMYTINKEVYKNNKAALSVYENYMKNNYNNAAWVRFQEILTDLGKQDKALAIKEIIAKSFPYSPSGFSDLAQYYYGIKQYSKAQDYINKALSLSSYDERYWASLGDMLSEQKNTAKAQEAYEKSLKCDPNQYDIINKIRKLGGKPELRLLPTVDVNQVINADKIDQAKNTDYGYYYILDQKDVVIYPGGATEEYINTVLRIMNQTGVDRYKETSIGYNNSQELLIEKAEIIKKNGARIEGEK